MDSRVAKKYKRDNHNSNINYVSTMLKGNMMLIIEVWKLDGTKTFPSLNVINGKTHTYRSKGILRHYNYWSDPKLGLVIVAIRIVIYSYRACATVLSLSLDLKTKESLNQLKYGRVYDFKYSRILGCHNNWIIFFSHDGKY